MVSHRNIKAEYLKSNSCCPPRSSHQLSQLGHASTLSSRHGCRWRRWARILLSKRSSTTPERRKRTSSWSAEPIRRGCTRSRARTAFCRTRRIDGRSMMEQLVDLEASRIHPLASQTTRPSLRSRRALEVCSHAREYPTTLAQFTATITLHKAERLKAREA